MTRSLFEQAAQIDKWRAAWLAVTVGPACRPAEARAAFQAILDRAAALANRTPMSPFSTFTALHNLAFRHVMDGGTVLGALARLPVTPADACALVVENPELTPGEPIPEKAREVGLSVYKELHKLR